MSNYTVILVAIDLPDDMMFSASFPTQLSKTLKGEIWNKRTNKRYTEHAVSLEEKTTYDEGYEKAIEKLFAVVKNDDRIRQYYAAARYVELQIHAWIDNDDERFAVHLTPENLAFLNSLSAHVDISVYDVS